MAQRWSCSSGSRRPALAPVPDLDCSPGAALRWRIAEQLHRCSPDWPLSRLAPLDLDLLQLQRLCGGSSAPVIQSIVAVMHWLADWPRSTAKQARRIVHAARRRPTRCGRAAGGQQKSSRAVRHGRSTRQPIAAVAAAGHCLPQPTAARDQEMDRRDATPGALVVSCLGFQGTIITASVSSANVFWSDGEISSSLLSLLRPAPCTRRAAELDESDERSQSPTHDSAPVAKKGRISAASGAAASTRSRNGDSRERASMRTPPFTRAQMSAASIAPPYYHRWPCSLPLYKPSILPLCWI
jgi:hypothetical protein